MTLLALWKILEHGSTLHLKRWQSGEACCILSEGGAAGPKLPLLSPQCTAEMLIRCALQQSILWADLQSGRVVRWQAAVIHLPISPTRYRPSPNLPRQVNIPVACNSTYATGFHAFHIYMETSASDITYSNVPFWSKWQPSRKGSFYQLSIYPFIRGSWICDLYILS